MMATYIIQYQTLPVLLANRIFRNNSLHRTIITPAAYSNSRNDSRTISWSPASQPKYGDVFLYQDYHAAKRPMYYSARICQKGEEF